MICTQVVPFMPPISTYRIISAPTTAITTRLAGRRVDAEQQRDEAAGAGHLREQVEEARPSASRCAAAMRTGRCLSRNDRTSAMVNRPVLRSSSATSSSATSHATRNPIE